MRGKVILWMLSVGFFFSMGLTPAPTALTPPAPTTNVYYIAPTGGNDSNPGTLNSPWATFDHAWTVLKPGDTLYLKDGTYNTPSTTVLPGFAPAIIQPTINGSLGKPIRIQALNDGKALIDGRKINVPIRIGQPWSYSSDPLSSSPAPENPWGNYIELDGMVAKDSAETVYEIYSRNVTLRRDSGYNANPNENEGIFVVWSQGNVVTPANILIEDSVAAGSGRKMFLAWDTYNNVVLRRNFSAFQTFKGTNACEGFGPWPQADGIEIYPKSGVNQPDIINNSIVENNILFGLNPDYGISLSPNPGTQTRVPERIGNKYLGDISLGAGMIWDDSLSTPIKFKVAPYTVSPDRSTCTYNGVAKPSACSTVCIDLQGNNTARAGFAIAATNSYLKDNTFQDLFAAYNAGLGLATGSWTGSVNNQLLNSTFVHNGQAPSCSGGAGNCFNWSDTDVLSGDLSRFTTVSNLKVGHGSNPSPGIGAQLLFRYVNGVLQDGTNGTAAQPLWPWQMEGRIQTEFADPTLFQANVNGQIGVWKSFSVNNVVCEQTLKPNGAVPADFDCFGRAKHQWLPIILHQSVSP